MSLLSALLFGLLPVLKYAGIRGAEALQGAARGDSRTLSPSRGQHRSQNALVFVQVALAVVLLVASGLMIRSFQALRSVEPGFTDPDHIQTMRISIPEGQAAAPERVARMQQDILDEIARIPGVTSAAFASALPMELEYENNMVVTAEDKTYGEGIPPLRRSKIIAPGFFQTLGIPLLAGRDFTWTDVHDRRAVAVVSNSLASELWGGPSAALGKRIRVGRAGPLNEIVGVVGDIYDSGVDQSPPAIVYWRAGAQAAPGPAQPVFIPRDMTFAIRSDADRHRGSHQTSGPRRVGSQPEPSSGPRANARGDLRAVDVAHVVHAGHAGDRRVHGARTRHCRHLWRDLLRSHRAAASHRHSPGARCSPDLDPAALSRTGYSSRWRGMRDWHPRVARRQRRPLANALRCFAVRPGDAGQRHRASSWWSQP